MIGFGFLEMNHENAAVGKWLLWRIRDSDYIKLRYHKREIIFHCLF